MHKNWRHEYNYKLIKVQLFSLDMYSTITGYSVNTSVYFKLDTWTVIYFLSDNQKKFKAVTVQ